jgi:hypothetical protein
MRKLVTLVVLVLTVGSVSSQANAGLMDGLVAEWQLDGNGNDSGGNGHDGVVSGATATEDRFGNPTGALQFDGVSAHVSVPNAPDLNPTSAITFTAWFKYASFDLGQLSWPTIIGKVGGDTNASTGWELVTSNVSEGNPSATAVLATDGTFKNSWWQPGYFEVMLPVTVDQWYFAAGVYDGSQMTLYLGQYGQPLDSVSDSGSGSIVNSSSDLWIGGDPDPNNWARGFDGAIDDVRIYNRALSAGEFDQLYTGTPEPSPLVLLGIGAIGLFTYAWRKRRAAHK